MTLVTWWLIFVYATGCHSRMYNHGSSWTGYDFHTYPHPAKKTIIPRDTMVDVINNLGLKLLAIHNEYNENNIAISPYGALSVLVALGEGLEGEAVYEIKQAAHLPNDISTIRVGLRDIHRHLKSYFIPKEGFLAGLTLNHENVTLRPEYEEILKFYGYDIVSFNNAVFPPLETTQTPETITKSQIPTEQSTESTVSTQMGKNEPTDPTTTETMTVITTESSTTTTTVRMTTTMETEGSVTTLAPETTTSKITTENTATTLDVSTTSTLPPTTTTERITMEPKTLEITTPSVTTSTDEVTHIDTVSTQAATTTTEKVPTTTENILVSETTEGMARTTRDVPTTIVMSTTESITTTAGTQQSTTPMVTEETITELSTQNPSTSPAETTTNSPSTTLSLSTQNVVTTLLPVTSTLTSTPMTSTEVSMSTDKVLSTPPTVFDATDESPVIDPLPISTSTSDEFTEITDATSTESGISTTDNKVNEIDATDISIENIAVKRQARHSNNIVELNMKEDMLSIDSKRSTRSLFDYIVARYYDDHYLISHRHQRPYIPKEELSFLIYGKYREYNINFMNYDTVLPFYYIPHLNTMALSFPLDSTKYYLLLLLPVDETGIDKLVCDLRLNGSLKYIIANLRYTHVVATIPSFTLKGYVTLTPSFQKLGIRKVFEPRQADFTPMTNHSQIYVTNIEQAITVTIRNYMDPDTMHNYRNLHQYNPVHFKADHPFLYFVIDTEIHVTLMAGKIVNPLNSRIS